MLDLVSSRVLLFGRGNVQDVDDSEEVESQNVIFFCNCFMFFLEKLT